MSEPGKPKLADAIPAADELPHPKHTEHPHDDAHKADVQQENREVNEGIKTNKDRLIDIGRGEQAAGRHTNKP